MRWFLSHHSVLSCINGGLGFELCEIFFMGANKKDLTKWRALSHYLKLKGLR